MVSWEGLAERLREGDVVAADAVARFVTGYLATLGAYRARDSWDDLVQEVLLAMLRNPPTRSDAAATTSWLRSTTHRAYVDHIRKERGRRRRKAGEPADSALGWRRNVPLDEVGPLRDTGSGDPDAGLDEGLSKALERLDERTRRVLMARYVLGHSNPEGAAAVGESVSTYRRLLEGGLARLREMLVPGGDES